MSLTKRSHALLWPWLFLALILVTGCWGRGYSEPPRDVEHAPIVPGFSLAGIDIDSGFSTVREIYGEPEAKIYEGGYLHLYYGRLKQEVERDFPGAWHLVLILYDNGNGELDDSDRVGQIEVSEPYYGTTLKQNGLGSSPRDLEDEFGECSSVSRLDMGSAIFLNYAYSRVGVEFLVEEASGQVITVVVTAQGGLKPAAFSDGNLQVSTGDVFLVTGREPILPGVSAAGIKVGDLYSRVKEIYGLPNQTGSNDELVYASYTGGSGGWKLTVYMEDTDKNRRPGDFDIVLSINLRYPYAGKTPRGVGIGSTSMDVSREFGAPSIKERTTMGGPIIQIWQYPEKGIVFAIDEETSRVVEIDVNRISSTP